MLGFSRKEKRQQDVSGRDPTSQSQEVRGARVTRGRQAWASTCRTNGHCSLLAGRHLPRGHPTAQAKAVTGRRKKRTIPAHISLPATSPNQPRMLRAFLEVERAASTAKNLRLEPAGSLEIQKGWSGLSLPRGLRKEGGEGSASGTAGKMTSHFQSCTQLEFPGQRHPSRHAGLAKNWLWADRIPVGKM